MGSETIGRLRAALTMSPFVVAGFVGLGLLAAFAGGMLDRETVGSRSVLRHVTLGYPYHWISQDQSWMSPPFPTRLGVDNPMDSPTHLDQWSFAVDALLWMLVLLAGFIVIRAVVRRRAPAR
jgi:hypothetical protein